MSLGLHNVYYKIDAGFSSSEVGQNRPDGGAFESRADGAASVVHPPYHVSGASLQAAFDLQVLRVQQALRRPYQRIVVRTLPKPGACPSLSAYARGCRCDDCKALSYEYRHELFARKKRERMAS